MKIVSRVSNCHEKYEFEKETAVLPMFQNNTRSVFIQKTLFKNEQKEKPSLCMLWRRKNKKCLCIITFSNLQLFIVLIL